MNHPHYVIDWESLDEQIDHCSKWYDSNALAPIDRDTNAEQEKRIMTDWPKIVKTRNKLNASHIDQLYTTTALYLYLRHRLPHLPAASAYDIVNRYDHARRVLTHYEFILQDRTPIFIQDAQNTAARIQNADLQPIHAGA